MVLQSARTQVRYAGIRCSVSHGSRHQDEINEIMKRRIKHPEFDPVGVDLELEFTLVVSYASI
jgi:hypothetical protein